jgi:hypothetical protein
MISMQSETGKRNFTWGVNQVDEPQFIRGFILVKHGGSLCFDSDTTLPLNLFGTVFGGKSPYQSKNSSVTSSPSITCCWRPLLGKTLPDDSINRSAKV